MDPASFLSRWVAISGLRDEIIQAGLPAPMAASSSSSVPNPAPDRAPAPRRPFPALGRRGLIVVGLCFGLAYGITQRILSLDLGEWRPLSHPFDVKPRPGTGLEQLRQRFGASRRPIQADLEALELEKASREAEARQRREQAEQERQLQEEQQQLERDQALPPPVPAAGPLPEQPPAPVLPPPLERPAAAPEPPVPQP